MADEQERRRLEAEYERMQREERERDEREREAARQRENDRIRAENELIQQVQTLSKIPDPLKNLPEYSGDEKTLFFWIDKVDRMLTSFEPIRHTSIYPLYLDTIRSKVTGEAHERLIEEGVNNTWRDIKTILIRHFADNRDMETIIQSIPFLKQEEDLDKFYTKVVALDANIAQKIRLDREYHGHENAVISFAKKLTKTAFVDGLKIGRTEGLINSPSLHDAYKEAKMIESSRERRAVMRQIGSSTNSSKDKKLQQNQSRPQKPQYMRQNVNEAGVAFPKQQPPYYPNYHAQTQWRDRQPAPQSFNRQQNIPQVQNNQAAVRNNAPIPMEVDPSMRSRRPQAEPMSGSFRAHVNNIENKDDDIIENDSESSTDEEDLNFQAAQALKTDT